MTREEKDQNKLEEYNRLKESLNDRILNAKDLLHLAIAAREAGLSRESKYNVLKAGELEPEDPSVIAALTAELSPEEYREWLEAHKKETPFWRDLKSILLYPAGKEGLSMLGIAALFFSAGEIFKFLLAAVPLLTIFAIVFFVTGGILGIAIILVLPGFYTSITWRTALGKEGFPGWPGFSDVFANLIGPALKVLLVAAWSFMPLLVMMISTAKKNISPSVSLTVFTLLLGLVYFPMAFLMMVMSQKLWPSLLPSQVIDSMVKSGRDYLKLCLLFWAFLLPSLPALLLWEIPVIGPLATVFTGLYCWACSMHLLGRFYRYEKDKLNWF